MLCATIAELYCVQTCEKVLTGTEKGWSNGQVHLVDESRAKVLPNRCRTAANPDILTFTGWVDSRMRPTMKLRNPHRTFKSGEESAMPLGLANGVGNGAPRKPQFRCGMGNLRVGGIDIGVAGADIIRSFA
jgi:hypothetical protein